MKHSGRNIKQRLYGLTLIGNRLSRIRHFRGHGVHSPFVYSLVRKVFMRRTFIDNATTELYDTLITLKLPQKRAVELQNVMSILGYTTYSIDDIQCPAEFNILSPSLSVADTTQALNRAIESGGTVAIIMPYISKERDLMCRECVAAHHSTSIDNRGYILFFNNHLPKQHYRL